MLAGETAEETLNTTRAGYFEALGVDYRPGWEAVALKPKARQKEGDKGGVEFTNGQSLPYQYLLIATGSAPLLPPIPGLDRPGVFTRLDRSGCKLLKEAAKGKQSAAVIGGGFLGVEMAQALRSLGLAVTIFEMDGRLLATMLDLQRSALALELVKGLGIGVKRNARVIAIDGEGEKGPASGLTCAYGSMAA